MHIYTKKFMTRQRFIDAVTPPGCVPASAEFIAMLEEAIEDRQTLLAAINQELRKPLPWRPKRVRGQ